MTNIGWQDETGSEREESDGDNAAPVTYFEGSVYDSLVKVSFEVPLTVTNSITKCQTAAKQTC